MSEAEGPGRRGGGGVKGQVTVSRHWNDWRCATVPVEALDGFHWTDTSGGIGKQSPMPFLHAYVSCDAIVEGELAHSCTHGPGPHRIKVCVLRHINEEVFESLAALSGEPDRRDTYNGEALCPRCGREVVEGEPACWPDGMEISEEVSRAMTESIFYDPEVCEICLVELYREAEEHLCEKRERGA